MPGYAQQNNSADNADDVDDGSQQAQNNNKINSSLCRGSDCDVCCCCCHFLHLSVWSFIYDVDILVPPGRTVKG